MDEQTLQAMVERLLTVVAERLEARRHSAVTVSLAADAAPEEQLLLRHQHILLTDVTCGQWLQLAGGIRTPWIQWLDKAIAYECEVTIQTAVRAGKMLSPSVVLAWPVTFRDKYQRRMYGYRNRYVTASALADCEMGAVVLLYEGQRLTDLAWETAARRQLEVIEGNGRYADR